MKIKKKLKFNYDNNGFVVYKKLITSEQVKSIKKDLKNFVSKNSSLTGKREINYIKNTNLVNSLHNLKKWSFLKKMQSDPKILNLVRLFLGEKEKKFGAELFAKPAKLGMEAPIHQDNYYWNIDNSKGLTLWIALDNSDGKNGGVYYYKKSHKIGLLEHKSSYAPGSSQKLKYKKVLNFFKKVTPSLKAGDALIHDCLIIHGSKKNISKNSRTGLTMRYMGNKSKIDPFLKKKYEMNLKKQIKIRK